jgi:hypothetical protein
LLTEIFSFYTVFSVELDSARPHGSSARDRMTEGIKKKKKVPEGTYIVTVQRQIGRYIFRSRILQ